MYFEMQILVISNNHEHGVLMNGRIKCVENQGKINECMHVKCKYVVIVMLNNSLGIKFTSTTIIFFILLCQSLCKIFQNISNCQNFEVYFEILLMLKSMCYNV